MAVVELSLAAALRDVDARRPEARSVAVRSLAPALLEAIGREPPACWEQIDHPARAEVLRALDRACDDPSPQNAALARVGLAQLGAPVALARAYEAIAHGHEATAHALEATEAHDPRTSDADEPDHAAVFLRECGVIALSLLAAGARGGLDDPELEADTRARYQATIEAIHGELRTLLTDPRPDLRFQAAPALAEVAGAAAEADLADALGRERHPLVRENLIAALGLLPGPSPRTCDALAALLADSEQPPDEGVAWQLALTLAGARRPEAAPPLLLGLRRQATRDQALEALAVIGPHLDAEGKAAAKATIMGRTDGFLVPVFTKVRAAYALARIDPPTGEAALARWAKHLRPAVRDAVREARELLLRLATEDASRDAQDS